MPRNKCPCGRHPIYGLPGDTKPTWCSMCDDKPDDATNVVTKKCPCGKRPYFGHTGETPRWCNTCPDKPLEAVNVVSKKCKCGKAQPSFGLSGGKALWCGDCKPEDAIDVLSKKCSCGKRSHYGLQGGKSKWCKDCKPDDAVNVTNKKCPCGKRPSFGLPDKTPKWCINCKPEEAINNVSKICPGYDGVSCPVRTHLAPGKAYCLSCDPDESRRLPRKKDEHAFFCFLKKHNIDVTQREYRIDYKCVNTSKSHAFIDGIIITPDIVICLEVDEDAHRNYSCDEARTNFASTELLLAFPEHHISWIRVNPTIGDFDRSDKALRLRDERYFDAVLSIRYLIQKPRTGIIYVGYPFTYFMNG